MKEINYNKEESNAARLEHKIAVKTNSKFMEECRNALMKRVKDGISTLNCGELSVTFFK